MSEHTSDDWESLANEWYDMRRLIKDIDNELNKEGITDSSAIVTIQKMVREFNERNGEVNRTK